MEIGYGLIEHEPESLEVRGRDLVTGLPKQLHLNQQKFKVLCENHFFIF